MGLLCCARINNFYTGNLTQDRIGYEVFSANVRRYAARVVAQSFNQGAPTAPIERAPGPERDLNYGYGLSIEMVAAAGLFSLGAMPGPGSGYAPLDSIWNRSVAELNAGRPLLGFNCCHVFVIRGYERRGTRRLLYLNDPWPQPNMPGQYAFDIDSAGRPLGQLEGFMSYPSHPSVAQMEPEALRDSDGDGVWDFDEINRFHTDPNNTDSDGDGVPDKRDIESGIYETEFGYGYAWNPSYNSPGRELDGDGTATELDPDSDDGGCKDGEEDVDHDGYRGGSETGNFKPGDDVCGNLQGNVSYAIHLINTDPGQIIRVIQDAGVIQVRLKPESPGSEHYVDDGSTFSYNGYARVEVDLGGCILFGRENASGSGTFTGDAEIGASRGDDGTLALGAQADVAGRAASGGCGQPGGSGPASRTMNFPDCDGVLAPQGAGPPGYKTYRFNCTTMALPPGPGWRLLSYYVRGYVRVQ